jgi:hypothetical protein
MTGIGSGAFSGCSSLVEVDLPKGITALNGDTFSGCSSLKQIKIPKGVNYLYDNEFLNCVNLENIEFPDTILSCGRNIIKGTKYLSDIPDDFVVISQGCLIAYKGEDKNVIVPDKVKLLSDGQFENSDIISISLPDTLEIIPIDAFSNCVDLKTVHLGKKITNISYKAFSNCSSLADINFENELIAIEDEAFINCTNLQKISIPASVIQIKSKAFYNCNNLSEVNLANQQITVDGTAFDDTMWLKNYKNDYVILPNGTLLRYIGKENTTTIPEDVKDISRYAFSGKNGLKKIVIPASLQHISEDAFASCEVTEIDIEEGVLSIDYDAFSSCEKLLKLLSRQVLRVLEKISLALVRIIVPTLLFIAGRIRLPTNMLLRMK